MPTTRDGYIFDDAPDAPELLRLKALEAIFDEKTREWLLSAGPLAARSCLEVGAGAGSIAAWLATETGAHGRVVAIDTNVRFLGHLPANVEVVEANLADASLPAEHFDLVHARYVLIHNADGKALVEAMLRVLKPGGTLVLEEPDFSAASALVGPTELKQGFEKVRLATEAMFASRGMDYALGRHLPELIREMMGGVARVEYDSPTVPGASKLAEMMRLSTLALASKYIATGCVTPEDVARYAEFAAAPDCWGIYYATVRVVALKPVT